MSGPAINVRRDMAPEIVRYVRGLVEMRDRWIILNFPSGALARVEDEIAKYNGHAHELGSRYCGICGWDRLGGRP